MLLIDLLHDLKLERKYVSVCIFHLIFFLMCQVQTQDKKRTFENF